MGTTSQKLTYLNDTKTLLKYGINSIGGNISNQTTFRDYATQLENIYQNLPKVSGSGSNISLSPTKVGRITSQIKGDTLQNGTPTPDSPVAIQSVTGQQNISVCGKNFAKMKNGTYTQANNTLVITNNNLLTINSNTAGSNTYISLGNGYNQQWSPTQAQYVNINDMKLTSNGGDYIATIYSNKTSNAQIQFTIITSKNRSVTVSNLQNNTQGTLSISLESDEHIKDIGMWMSGNNVFDNYQVQVQIEKGSTATTYEAYNGETYPINLGTIELNKIGTYQDYISGTPNNWIINKNIGEYILDSNKNWYATGTGNKDYQVTLGGNDRIYLKQSATGYSNYFRVSNSGSDIFMWPILQGSTDYIRIVNAIDKWSTLDAFKTFITNNTVELIFPLATPTTTPITNQELITQLNNWYYAMSKNGETNISVDGSLPVILDVSALEG